MSYVVELIHPIGKEELLAIVGEDSELSIAAEGENWVDVVWSRGAEHALFNFGQGRISITSPSRAGWEKSRELAQRLGAKVFGEEDQAPNRTPIPPGVFAGRSTWIGWPLFVIVLGVLLVWRW